MKKILLTLLAAGLLTACGGETDTKENKEEVKQEEPTQGETQEKESGEMTLEEKKTATDLPLEIYNVVTGDGSVAGQMSLLTIPEAEITDEYIKTWYNKIKGLDNNYDIIISEESIDGDKAKGVMNLAGLVTKNCEFTKADDGVYMLSNDDNQEVVDVN